MPRMFSRLREDIAVVFDRDPAARTRWESADVLSGAACPGLAPVRCPIGCGARPALARPLARALVSLADRNRDPSGSDGRAPRLHRPRDGNRDRGNAPKSTTIAPSITGCTPGWDVVEGGQAPSDTGQRSGDRALAPRSLDPILVGDGAKIGCNAVVVRDVPAGATAVGIPRGSSTGDDAQSAGKPCREDGLSRPMRSPPT